MDIIDTYVLRMKGQKQNLNLKYVTMIDPVTRWFEIMHYNDKIAMSILNLVETTCLSRYPIRMEITYKSVSLFIGNEFIKTLIER